MRTQPSHRLVCPHPCPSAQADPQVPHRAEAEAAPARNRDARVGGGHSSLTLLGDGPGVSFAPNGGATDGHDPPLGPRKYLKCLKWGLRLPRGRERKYPHLRHRDLWPPAARELPATFPPNALPTQIHTNTPIPCAAASRGGGGGRKRPARKGSERPSRAGSVLPRNSSHQQAGHRRAGFQDTDQVHESRSERVGLS